MCKRCSRIVAEYAGNVLVLRHGPDRTEITGAINVTRTCRHCGEKNALIAAGVVVVTAT